MVFEKGVSRKDVETQRKRNVFQRDQTDGLDFIFWKWCGKLFASGVSLREFFLRDLCVSVFKLFFLFSSGYAGLGSTRESIYIIC